MHSDAELDEDSDVAIKHDLSPRFEGDMNIQVQNGHQHFWRTFGGVRVSARLNYMTSK